MRCNSSILNTLSKSLNAIGEMRSFSWSFSLAILIISAWSKARDGRLFHSCHCALLASSPAITSKLSLLIRAKNATVSTRSRGSLSTVLKTWNCSRYTSSTLVSSYSSLFAPSSTVSSIFRKPPGKAHEPLYGSKPRSMRRILILVPSKPKITQSVVTAGCGYLYVYINYDILIFCCKYTA